MMTIGVGSRHSGQADTQGDHRGDSPADRAVGTHGQLPFGVVAKPLPMGSVTSVRRGALAPTPCFPTYGS
jgi:hypothetical protein